MSSPALRVSVLDQSPVPEGATGSQALRQSVELARLADRLGYHRYWVAEHHGGQLVSGPSPEVLIGPLASATTRMRVGSGGVMLPHYSPLKVAENFSVLSGLFPERIDLGIGRASGTDPMTTQALQRDRTRAMPDDFFEQLVELVAYYDHGFPEGHPLGRLADVLPGRPEVPEVSLLGSSPQSAIWAGELGLPYVFADFINMRGAAYMDEYRGRFADSERLMSPRVSVGVWAIAADTEEEALMLGTSWRMALNLLMRGTLITVPPPEKALRFLEGQGERLDEQMRGHRSVLGTPAQVRAGIEEIAASYGAEEVFVVTITHDHQARLRSYELLAREFGLDEAPEPADEAALSAR